MGTNPQKLYTYIYNVYIFKTKRSYPLKHHLLAQNDNANDWKKHTLRPNVEYT